MAFKADAGKIKRWREERQWSQEYLAERARLGLRTVQRIEKGDPASRGSLTALAGAYGVEVTALMMDVEAEATALGQFAKALAVMRHALWIHGAGFGLGLVVFIGVNLAIGGDGLVMKWLMIWWGLGLFAHGLIISIAQLLLDYRQAR